MSLLPGALPTFEAEVSGAPGAWELLIYSVLEPGHARIHHSGLTHLHAAKDAAREQVLKIFGIDLGPDHCTVVWPTHASAAAGLRAAQGAEEGSFHVWVTGFSGAWELYVTTPKLGEDQEVATLMCADLEDSMAVVLDHLLMTGYVTASLETVAFFW